MLYIKEEDQILEKINSHINLISKKNSEHGAIIHWFQQSPLHWFLILYVMKYYIEDVELSKNEVLELINNNVVAEGKKTTTTEFKYINDAILKGYLISTKSLKDARKRTLIPTENTAKILIGWFEKYGQII